MFVIVLHQPELPQGNQKILSVEELEAQLKGATIQPKPPTTIPPMQPNPVQSAHPPVYAPKILQPQHVIQQPAIPTLSPDQFPALGATGHQVPQVATNWQQENSTTRYTNQQNWQVKNSYNQQQQQQQQQVHGVFCLLISYRIVSKGTMFNIDLGGKSQENS